MTFNRDNFAVRAKAVRGDGTIQKSDKDPPPFLRAPIWMCRPRAILEYRLENTRIRAILWRVIYYQGCLRMGARTPAINPAHD
jgi:hypothetical protein